MPEHTKRREDFGSRANDIAERDAKPWWRKEEWHKKRNKIYRVALREFQPETAEEERRTQI